MQRLAGFRVSVRPHQMLVESLIRIMADMFLDLVMQPWYGASSNCIANQTKEKCGLDLINGVNAALVLLCRMRK